MLGPLLSVIYEAVLADITQCAQFNADDCQIYALVPVADTRSGTTGGQLGGLWPLLGEACPVEEF